jgi:nitrogen regulatory protein P-II 1
MIRVVAYIKPHRLEGVKAAVAALGVTGLTVADVRGTGVSEEHTDLLSGAVVALPIRSRLEVVVPDEMREDVVSAIVESARTGEPNDGKIFVERVAEAIRVRTGERGEAAV